jgi:serine protease
VRKFAWVMLLSVALAGVAAAITSGDIERNPVRRHPLVSTPSSTPLHIIVKLRGGTAAASKAQVRPQLQGIAARSGLILTGTRSITAELHVLHLQGGAAQVADTLARLRADPQVQYAEVDQRRYIHSVPPDDTLYSEQWYLMPSSATTPSAIDAQTAWNMTTGPQGLVIADIDTGVRFDHPDLLSTTQSGGRLLPGYCFISDALVANNGTCPGSDASDPGDWITGADLNQPECANENTSVSSWHGTRVAGMLGAIANNAQGIAGVTWNTQVLPVRALGVCGGLDSDIISGMLWAAGIAVDGVPANPTPAKIINMSLGGVGSCPADYQDAVNQITALGVLIVVSAGNEGGPVDAPANCLGVAGVAGLRHAGTKVGFSSLGPEVALGAPGGNCVNTSSTQPCVYSLVTTTNLGTTTPGSNDYTGLYYCDPTTGSMPPNCVIGANQYRTYNLGTSFAAPQVAGIGALMLAVNSKLNSCQVISRLQEGSLPYPQTSVGETPQPAMCHVPVSQSDVQDAECICTLDGRTCGAGMANASGALNAAGRPIAAVTLPATVTAGQPVVLKAGGSAAANNHTITTFGWTSVGAQSVTIQNASSSSATVSLPACGLATVAVTVTDDAGRTDTAQVVLAPSAASSAAPAVAGQACSDTPPAVQVEVCPGTATVKTGASETLDASLVNTADTTVTWEVNGIAGGNATVGTITSNGVYTAPAAVPAGGTVTVTAVSEADDSKTAEATLTITAASSSGGGGGGGQLDWAILTSGALALLMRQRLRRKGSAGACRGVGWR